MERHSGTQAVGEVAAVVSAAQGGEAGLEEPLWQLSLSGGLQSYPERPHEADCIYYLRTGLCGYGARCRFNHPRDRSFAARATRASWWEYPERVDQPPCQYYMRTGMCKFGASCKYHHPRQGGGSAPVTMNVYGYPSRPGEKECAYYIKTGQCKFGVTCKFHHPQPTTAPVAPPVQSSQQFGTMAGNWSIARPTLLPGGYMPGAYSHMLFPPGVVHLNYGLAQLSPSSPAYPGAYMYAGSTAAPSQVSQRTNFVLSHIGLPLRPDAPMCLHYSQNGVCKYGPTCKFDHPMGTLSYSPSASSLADMPVAPFPVGSYISTLAPPSSSSDSRPNRVSQSSGVQQPGQTNSASGVHTSTSKIG